MMLLTGKLLQGKARAGLCALIALFLSVALSAGEPADAATKAKAKTAVKTPAPVVVLTPSQTIDAYNNALADAVHKSESGGFEARRAAFAPLIAKSFDLPFMAKYLAGQYWTPASETDRPALVDAFRDYTVASYATRFKSLKDNPFKVVAEVPRTDGTTIIRTTLTRTSGEVVKVDYRVHQAAANAPWTIVDVSFNGSSQLLQFKNDFSSTLRTGGVSGLISALKSKVIEIAQTGVAPGGTVTR